MVAYETVSGGRKLDVVNIEFRRPENICRCWSRYVLWIEVMEWLFGPEKSFVG